MLFDRRSLLISLACAGLTGCASRQAADGRDAALDQVFREHQPPALAAAIVTSTGLEWSGVRGVRRSGSIDTAKIDDVWHLGSCTKAMTAALWGRLVEQGKADWHQTVPQLFSGMEVDPLWETATIKSLFLHRAGLSDGPWLTDEWVTSGQTDGSDLREQRRDLARRVLGKPPHNVPGTMEYSNLNYILAGAAMEAITDQSWEDLMSEELFQPLGIKSGGFGAARGNAPWPHRTINSKPVPIDPGRHDSDNPAVLGPAGTVHMNLQDYARFVRVFLNEGSPLLSPDTIKTLTTPFQNTATDYALGWVIATNRAWAKGPIAGHEGTNTLNHAYCVIAPSIGRAIIAFSNDGSRGALATVSVSQRLIDTLG